MEKKVKKAKVERTAELPSNPKELQKFRGMIGEAVTAELVILSGKEKVKEIVEEILSEFPIEKKIVKKLIRLEVRDAYAAYKQEAEQVSEAYEKLHEDDA